MRTRVERAVAAVFVMLAAGAAAAPTEVYRYEAAIDVQRTAPFIELPLPASAYAHAEQSGLADLRVVDARDRRVPFALIDPAPAPTVEASHAAALYRMPVHSGRAASAALDLTIDGERIDLRRLAPATAADAPADAWLIDLGERRTDQPAPQRVRLAWSGPPTFNAGYTLAGSDDLQHWHAGGSGQLIALQAAGTVLTQPDVVLPADAGRYLILRWLDPAAAPQLSGATAVALRADSNDAARTTELDLTGTADPASGALDVDLGAVLPVTSIDLRQGSTTAVTPVRLQSRQRADEPWHELASAVYYRIDRPEGTSISPPLRVQASLRYLRVLPDARAGTLDPATTRLQVRAALARVVFAAQGEPPYRLQAGSADAPAGALPIVSLVPVLADERGRFGAARLTAWRERPEAAEHAASAARMAALRTWGLWAVLLAGVAVLAWMVWRLAKSNAALARRP
ncbi:MAG: DUF3999 family protein [Proteobacteria bacterium]|nr:DUF3999 family protein [Pseudomonadota bacterium]